MVAAPQFSALLEILGGIELELRTETRHWNLYTVKFRTPAGEIKANYLYLASDCPRSEANSKNLSAWMANGPYTVVTTTKSRLSRDLPRTAKDFGAHLATTPRKLLIENVLQSVETPEQIAEDFQYFVEPEVAYSDTNSKEMFSVPALGHLVELLVSGQQIESDPIYAEVLVAPAGQGKTTLCRTIANKIRVTIPDAIPILVESNQWQRLIELTLPNVLNAALLQMIPGATHLTNPKVFQMLVREQILVPIFDGFDELSLHPHANASPASLLTELLNIIGGAEAKILLTVREAFWERHVASIPEFTRKQVRRLDLQGFSNQQRQQFFHRRLKSPEDRDIANRLSKEIGSRLYEGAVTRPTRQADRASGVPLMLELIALYVDGNPSATFAPKSQDPLGPLLQAVCERENVRQNLDISAEKQMLVFENLFRDYEDEIPREALELYVDDIVSGVTVDTIGRYESHAFLTPTLQDGFVPRFETLRVYFVARWLAYQLEGASNKEMEAQASKLLAQHASGNGDIFDYLVLRFVNEDPEKVFACISHACRMVNQRANSEGASSALFHLCQRLAHHFEIGRQEKTALIFRLMSGKNNSEDREELVRIAIQGQINGLDLAGRQFSNCEFKNVEFFNCNFDDHTTFVDSRFVGDLAFHNCSNVNQSRLESCRFSDTALIVWEERQGQGSKNLITEENARKALRDILKKFEHRFGFTSIKYTDRDSGPVSKNPCRERAWMALFKSGVVERHNISGVTEGGLKIVNVADIKHEVRNFLDNAAMGARLRRALREILN